MPFKDILVHLDGSEESRHRLDFALALAKDHGAHLNALYVFDLVTPLEASARAYGTPVEGLETYAKMRKAELDRTNELEAQFRARLRREGIAGEWRFVESLPAPTVALHARYADLTIVGQVDPENPPSVNAARVPEEVLLVSGRPVLVIPYVARYKSLGENVLVAWKPTREAARTLGDSLPLLEAARKVKVLTVNPEGGDNPEPGIPAADIALHLARHGVRVEAATMVAEDITVGDVLLNEVADSGADLLVMGGYGHSRARELILGGVTRQILRQMTVPVFMAH